MLPICRQICRKEWRHCESSNCFRQAGGCYSQTWTEVGYVYGVICRF